MCALSHEGASQESNLIRSHIASLKKENESLRLQLGSLKNSDLAQKRMSKHNYLFLDFPHSIRDPIYGDVALGEEAFATLDAQLFQRLKNLCATGPSFYVYYGLQQSRFAHSVGVYHLMLKALRHFALLHDVDFEPEQGRLCLAVALLHDIGHFPYSHVLEEIEIDGKHLAHEMLSAYLILNDTELSSLLHDKWGVNPEDAAKVLRKDPSILPKFLNKLIDSSVDLDKMDYLCRDAHSAGVPYGMADVNWLISSFLVDGRDSDLLLAERGIGAMEQFIFAKYLMYRNVYWHHTTREVTAMIKRACVDMFLQRGIGSLDPTHDEKLRNLCLATDARFEDVAVSLVGGKKLPDCTAYLLGKVKARKLYRRVHVMYAIEEKGRQRQADYMDALRRRRREEEICDAISKLPEWQGCASLARWAILIDVARPANFGIDIKGVYFKDPPASYAANSENVVPWNEQSYVSYFTRELLSSMEQSIRKVRFFYDPANPKEERLRDILRTHPNFY